MEFMGHCWGMLSLICHSRVPQTVASHPALQHSSSRISNPDFLISPYHRISEFESILEITRCNTYQPEVITLKISILKTHLAWVAALFWGTITSWGSFIPLRNRSNHGKNLPSLNQNGLPCNFRSLWLPLLSRIAKLPYLYCRTC